MWTGWTNCCSHVELSSDFSFVRGKRLSAGSLMNTRIFSVRGKLDSYSVIPLLICCSLLFWPHRYSMILELFDLHIYCGHFRWFRRLLGHVDDLRKWVRHVRMSVNISIFSLLLREYGTYICIIAESSISVMWPWLESKVQTFFATNQWTDYFETYEKDTR